MNTIAIKNRNCKINPKEIHIAGAGPSGLTAAINLARAGMRVIVHEKNQDVGMKFNGDFQGLENWSTEEEVPEFLSSIGISTNFLCEPYYAEFYGPSLKRISVKSSMPHFYLVERGVNNGSLDQGLKQQAIDAGIEIQWNSKLEKIKSKPTIAGTGPKAADVIAKGIVFNTSYPDCAFGFLDDRIAPKGYAYLLVHKGSATFAVCLFEDFQNEKTYFHRGLEALHKVIDIEITNQKEFGGFGNFFFHERIITKEGILYTGENAGFQDALWGFGLKNAMLSGYLAAKSILENTPYTVLHRKYIAPRMRVSLANRWWFARLRNRGYELFLSKIANVKDAMEVLIQQHRLNWKKNLTYYFARLRYRTRLIDKNCMHKDCDCIWCRHGKEHR